MGRLRKVVAGVVISAMILGNMGAVYAEQESKRTVLSNASVQYSNGTVWVSAAEIFKKLGKTVAWDQAKKQLIVGNQEMIFTLGQKQVSTDNGNYQLLTAPINKEGRLYIPLRCFADILGYTVSYQNNTINIEGTQKIGSKGSYTQKISEKRITISAAGDFTLGYYKGQGLGGRFDEVASAKGYSYFMKNVKDVFEKDDLTIVNLEGPLTTRGTAAEKQFAIRGLPAYTKILTEGDIEAVNLANNHTYDYQKVGYDDTVSALKKSGIDYFGESNTCYTIIDGVKIAMIGAKGWSNSASVKQSLKKRIQEAKKKAQIIIVEFHWGQERNNYPNSVQQDLAKYVVDQGANLVLGSHPHVIQGIGNYKGVNIVYSMGNFCFGANRNPSDKDTFIYQQTFVVTESGVTVEDYKVIPCSISSTSSCNNYQPTVLTGQAKEKVLKRLKTYSKNLK